MKYVATILCGLMLFLLGYLYGTKTIYSVLEREGYAKNLGSLEGRIMKLEEAK